jgi:hypothetical protein
MIIFSRFFSFFEIGNGIANLPGSVIRLLNKCDKVSVALVELFVSWPVLLRLRIVVAAQSNNYNIVARKLPLFEVPRRVKHANGTKIVTGAY